MQSELKEIIIGNTAVRRRDESDLNKWFSEIKSVLFPVSVKGKALRRGAWENCILTGQLSDDASGRLMMAVTFADATCIKARGSINSFIPEPYLNETMK